MNSSEENWGLALLRKWHRAEKDITLTFDSGFGQECLFTATGRVKDDPTDTRLLVEGKGFTWECNLAIVGFGPVCSEELLEQSTPALVGKQLEVITLLFSRDGMCRLEAKSAFAN